MRVRHAFTGWIYEETADGEVRVEDPSTGAWGIFTADAMWKSGELTNADFHMVRHVGGRHAESPGLYSRPAPKIDDLQDH